MQANAAVDRELRNEALEDLCIRVDDWKNHRVDHFGDLLLHGHFPVVTGNSEVQKEVRSNLFMANHVPVFRTIEGIISPKRKALGFSLSPLPHIESREAIDPQGDIVIPIAPRLVDQRQRSWHPKSSNASFLNGMVFYHPHCIHPLTGMQFLPRAFTDKMGVKPNYDQYTIYLFERILLCCKELNPNKSKDKLMGAQKDKKDKKDKRNRDPARKQKLQLKGRIFMTNVTEVLSLGKQGKS